MVSIPSNIFQTYRDYADEFINTFGVNCKFIYEPKLDLCPNCILDTITGRSSNIYKANGPESFNFGMCPLCNGEGYKRIESSEIIKLRVYWERKSWVKLDNMINIPDGSVQVIGFIYDIPKIKRAQKIILNNDLIHYAEWCYRLMSEPVPHGFQRNRYFITFLERQGNG